MPVLQRGIILGDSWQNGFLSDKINLDLIHQCLLFWDKIDYTNVTTDISWNGGEPQSMFPQLDYLKSIGIAQKNERATREEKVAISGKSGWDMTEYFLLEQYVTLKKNSESSDVIWSTINDISATNVITNTEDKRACIEVELYNLIPIPSKTAPFEDVLNFKEKRKDELLALRYYIDELSLEISSTEDFHQRKLLALDRLNHQLNNYHKVFYETKFQYIWRSLSAIATDPIVAIAGLVGTVGSLAIPVATPVFSKLAGGAVAASAIKYSYQEMFIPKNLPLELHNLSYISKVNNEFGRIGDKV